MAFSQASISGVTVLLEGAELSISWTSTAPPGTVFQVYVDQRLSWFGKSPRCHVPIPTGASGRNVWVEVGTVRPDEADLDFSAALSPQGGTGDRAFLSWLGGTYLDPSGHDDIQGFHVFQSDSAGAAVDLTQVVATVPAYPGGWISDGFGQGGFGQGGFGRAASSYQWTSSPLGTGVWQFAVIPYDKAGNAKTTGPTVTLAIQTAPLPPAAGPDGKRLNCAYDGPATRQATLSWLASPSDHS